MSKNLKSKLISKILLIMNSQKINDSTQWENAIKTIKAERMQG